MTSRDFCYWLQGYFEIEGNQPRPHQHSDKLNGEQIRMIKNHLAMVFKHEIDPSFGKDIGALEKIHNDGYYLDPKFSKDPSSIKFNC